MSNVSARLSDNLKSLRQSRGLTLEGLAEISSVSRATLSRIENADVSPTAEILGRLATAYGMSISRLMVLADESFSLHVPRSAQPFWLDPGSGLRRRVLSPPASGLGGEVVECELPSGARVDYDAPARPGHEHHVMLRSGLLYLTIDGVEYELHEGDTLRFRLYGPSSFQTPHHTSATYILVLVDG